jgi:hypothetical protein
MTQHPTPPTQGPQQPGCTCTRHSDTGKSPGAVQGMASRYTVVPHTHNGASPQGPHSAFGRGRGRCPSFITNADTHLGHHRDRQRRRQRRHLLATPRTHTEGQKGSMERTRPNKQTGSRATGAWHGQGNTPGSLADLWCLREEGGRKHRRSQVTGTASNHRCGGEGCVHKRSRR